MSIVTCACHGRVDERLSLVVDEREREHRVIGTIELAIGESVINRASCCRIVRSRSTECHHGPCVALTVTSSPLAQHVLNFTFGLTDLSFNLDTSSSTYLTHPSCLHRRHGIFRACSSACQRHVRRSCAEETYQEEYYQSLRCRQTTWRSSSHANRQWKTYTCLESLPNTYCAEAWPVQRFQRS